MNHRRALKWVVCFSWLTIWVAPVRGQGNFYEGKTVTVLIGAKSGSLEIAAQIVSHHLGKYLPGKPAVILQHMPGAAHLLATNNVFNVAKPDGLTILAANPNVAIAQLSKVEQVRFDVRKFLTIYSRCTFISFAPFIGVGQHVFAIQLVVQRVEPIAGRPLRFGVQRLPEFLNLRRRW